MRSANTSKGSKADTHRSPKISEPPTAPTNQATAHQRSTGKVLLPGCTSSSQANPSSVTTPGVMPTRCQAASLSGRSGPRGARTSRARVRNGLVSRQIDPKSSDTGTSPTQSHTNTKPNTGLVTRSWPNQSARAIQPYSARASRRANARVTGASTMRVSPGRANPAGAVKRGRRHASTRAPNDSSSARAAPSSTSSKGSGRSWREPSPCSGRITGSAARRSAARGGATRPRNARCGRRSSARAHAARRSPRSLCRSRAHEPRRHDRK